MKLPTMKEEADAAESRGEIYIPPYRMAELMKMAHKIMGVLAASGGITVSYAECDVVLELVKQAAKQGGRL